MTKLILALLILTYSCTPAYAYSSYSWKVLEVTDGDTIKVDASKNLPDGLNISVRILGIDTPEKGKRAKCKREEAMSIAATNFARVMINEAREVVFTHLRWDKFGGRVLAEVYVDGYSLGDKMIRAGLAREYHGKEKQSWCK